MTRTKSATPDTAFQPTPLTKVTTGIDGLDEVLCGGYPESRTTMIKGGPGAGKTLYALQYLVQNARQGHPGIFVTFEESAEAIRANAATLGWDLPALEDKALLFIYHARINPSVVPAGTFSLSGLTAIIDGKARSMGARRVVIDAIDILMRRFEDPFRARDELNALHQWLDSRKIASVLTVKSGEDPEMVVQYGFLDYMADCAVRLDHRMTDQISTRRLRVLKYRGSPFGTNEYPYVIGDRGVTLVPIASAQLRHRPLGPCISTGNVGLDQALDGGYRRNSCVLIAGSSGTGKTTLACTSVLASSSREERTLYVSYEESAEALVSAVLGAGIDLRPALAAGSLRLHCRLPESMGSDEHLYQDLAAVRSFEPNLVVVDAMSACQRMGSGKAAFDYCMRLVNDLKERGITSLFTNQTHATTLGDDLSGLGFASLVDTVIQLWFEPDEDEMRRSLVVMKARGSRHSARFHDLTITDAGMLVGPREAPARDQPRRRSGNGAKPVGGA